MSFTDHKITSFQHKIADLPDEPQIPAAELKSRFDACPEELRVAHNAVCDDAARLEARVEGIVVDSFGDTIDKEMLSDELAAELDGKATQSALSAEATAREAADSAEAAARTALAETVAQKCEVYFGSYTGNGAEERTINIGFTPEALLTNCATARDGGNGFYDGLALPGKPIMYGNNAVLKIVENGFSVRNESYTQCTNKQDETYNYIAFK